MTIKSRPSTLTSLQRMRAEARVDAETAVTRARRDLERAEQAWSEARARLSKLLVAERRDAEKVSAGALQRAEACRVALSKAYGDASGQVKATFGRVALARAVLEQAEQAWREARADEQVVERAVERRQADAQGARQRVEDEDNDERAQRR